MSYPDRFTRKVIALNEALLDHLGPRGWWPTFVPGQDRPIYQPGREGRTVSDAEVFEIIVGAILTQNNTWSNAAQAIVNLNREGLLNAAAIADSDGRVTELIRPARYFNQKSLRLKEIAEELLRIGGIPALRREETGLLRKRLLSWRGVGPETADAILCYALNRPIFVVDAYTGRLFERLGLPAGSYSEMQDLVHQSIPPSTALYGDFHARIVRLYAGKTAEAFIPEFEAHYAASSAAMNRVLRDFRDIPGVGEKIARDFYDMGFRSKSELVGQDPEDLYQRLNRLKGVTVDRCMLYVFRCAVYYVSTRHPDPEKCKWWHWKDPAP
ncbi:MAG: helix-hairpin-helix domain-containing protein [Thermodesulfobacteriota bacterium]